MSFFDSIKEGIENMKELHEIKTTGIAHYTPSEVLENGKHVRDKMAASGQFLAKQCKRVRKGKPAQNLRQIMHPEAFR